MLVFATDACLIIEGCRIPACCDDASCRNHAALVAGSMVVPQQNNGYVFAWISHNPAPMRPSRPSHGSRCETRSWTRRKHTAPYPGNQRLEASQTHRVALPLKLGQHHHTIPNFSTRDTYDGLVGRESNGCNAPTCSFRLTAALLGCHQTTDFVK